MDCIVHGVTKSWTRLSDFHFFSTEAPEETPFLRRVTEGTSEQSRGTNQPSQPKSHCRASENFVVSGTTTYTNRLGLEC